MRKEGKNSEDTVHDDLYDNKKKTKRSRSTMILTDDLPF